MKIVCRLFVCAGCLIASACLFLPSQSKAWVPISTAEAQECYGGTAVPCTLFYQHRTCAALGCGGLGGCFVDTAQGQPYQCAGAIFTCGAMNCAVGNPIVCVQ